jgi:hypothetical protein
LAAWEHYHCTGCHGTLHDAHLQRCGCVSELGLEQLQSPQDHRLGGVVLMCEAMMRSRGCGRDSA